ncbi:hypothetical protein [Delftia sp. PE138]|uniref:hypothetical protein n=1 Tax=Delftia sp. PE138 TaxID=1812483 RepID=UPI001BB06C52|nr:hypothetical protein [Delftia sp. PE138]MBS3721200.1 hypothetical protein [Delftia sp. PE138]
MIWDTKQLEDHVRSLYGDRLSRQLTPSLQSWKWRTGFAQYHYDSAQKEMQTGLGERDSQEIVSLILGFEDDEALHAYHVAQRKALANYVACIQSMHALADTFAHVIYFGLALELNEDTRLEERNISLYRVEKKLANVPDAVHLYALVQELKDHPEFKYLNRLTNLAKHRAIVDARYTVSCVDGVPDGFQLPAFSTDGVAYPARTLENVLSEEFRRQNVLQVDIGCELNDILAKRLSACPP